MNNNKKIEQLAEDFALKHNFNYTKYNFQKIELWDSGAPEIESKKWALFEKNAGVYTFIDNNEVLYIGKSIANTGGRLFDHLTNEEKLKKINDNTIVLIFSFDKNNKHLTSALESYLIETFQPLLNKKLG